MAKILFTYSIPESIRLNSEIPLPKKIVMRQLSADEELQAHRVGRAEYMKSQYDAVKRAIVKLDSQDVSYAEGTSDKFWENCGPKMRSLLLQAYNRSTAPTAEEESSFLGSAEIQTS